MDPTDKPRKFIVAGLPSCVNMTNIIHRKENLHMDDTPIKSYKVKEVAEKLGCSIDNVYRLIKYGQLEAFRIGGKRNFRVTDKALNDFISRMVVRNEELSHG